MVHKIQHLGAKLQEVIFPRHTEILENELVASFDKPVNLAKMIA
jgi:hypothetical protein